MALRLLDIYLPDGSKEKIETLFDEFSTLDIWHEHTSDYLDHVQLLLREEDVEPVLDLLEQKFSGVKDFRANLLTVEATIPRLPTNEASSPKSQPEKRLTRIHREELYLDISSMNKLTWIFVALVVLATVVTGIGLLRESVAIIIGGMVIAPLLGPNVALSLGTTLYDKKLIFEALKVNAVGFGLVLVLAMLAGLVLEIDPTSKEIASRTEIGIGDVALALASGAAGALAFSTRTPASLVGVMVAVALLPPLLVFGMLFSSGNWQSALGALLLLATNVICINLAGVTTFLLQGVRPRTWWETERAQTASRIALTIWGSLLLLLIFVIFLSQSRLP
jgi:uncharacterized hydrophobic protein (TIGR00341 family)